VGVTVTKSNRDPRLLIPSGLKPANVLASRIDAPVRRLSGATMGTGWSLSFVAHETLGTAAVVAALEDAFALVIRQMSGWERGSDLSQFNAAPVGWRDNPPEFAFVLNRALQIAALTDGAYDPSLGHHVEAAGFGSGLLTGQPVLQGWRSIRLDRAGLRVWQPGGVALDLSSIAKGYAVDLCADALRSLSVPSFLVEIGGEFLGQGVKPDAQPWWVGLELSDLPYAEDEPTGTDVALVNLAVATSGDFVRRREGGSHLLDGRTGQVVAGELSGVAVLHASAMEADAWATALFALRCDAGLVMAEAQGLAVVFAVRGEGGARTLLSSAAQEMLG
jgi:thiamine biosynthesis lipoprotein